MHACRARGRQAFAVLHSSNPITCATSSSSTSSHLEHIKPVHQYHLCHLLILHAERPRRQPRCRLLQGPQQVLCKSTAAPDADPPATSCTPSSQLRCCRTCKACSAGFARNCQQPPALGPQPPAAMPLLGGHCRHTGRQAGSLTCVSATSRSFMAQWPVRSWGCTSSVEGGGGGG